MTVEKKQQRVAIYARVSSQEQAVEGVSIEVQIAALKAYAKSHVWEVADEYIGGGFSGRLKLDDGRTLFDLVLDAARTFINTFRQEEFSAADLYHIAKINT